MAARKGETRGRTGGFRMSDEHRTKIQNSQILNALIEHTLGTREMGATQVTAGIALMRKVLPDLQNVQLTGADEGPVQVEEVGAKQRLHDRIAGIVAAASVEGSARRDH